MTDIDWSKFQRSYGKLYIRTRIVGDSRLNKGRRRIGSDGLPGEAPENQLATVSFERQYDVDYVQSGENVVVEGGWRYQSDAISGTRVGRLVYRLSSTDSVFRFGDENGYRDVEAR